MFPFTVVTPTVGTSDRRLSVLMHDLRRFASGSFPHIVCDDGTNDERDVAAQQEACALYGARHLVNPGPTWGVAQNLNYAVGHIETPWAFFIEDGLRPSAGWYEAALAFVDRIGDRTWNGRRVGMAGCAHIQDWMLALAGAIPTKVSVADWYQQHNACDEDFLASGWNDGLWTWDRLYPAWSKAEDHGIGEARTFLDVVNGLEVDRTTHEGEQSWIKYRVQKRWPHYRKAACAWYPGAFMLVNMELLRAVGGFREGCTFFEGHLGVRMGRAGHLSLALEFPPFLHQPSRGFRATGAGKGPRDHRGTDDVFR